MSHVEIATGSTGLARLSLEGRDISDAVRAYTFHHEGPGIVPKLVIEPAVIDRAEVFGEMDVYVSPAASDLLIRLGWTPPAGAS